MTAKAARRTRGPAAAANKAAARAARRATGAPRSPVAPAGAPLHYRACGLPDVWLLNGFRREDTPDGPAVRIEDADGLHRTLAEMIVARRAPMTREELRYLRRFLALSQANLAALLGISEQTVARWEKGEARIDPIGERLVRFIVTEHLGGDVIVREALEALAADDEAAHGGDGDGGGGVRRLHRRGRRWRAAA